MSSSIGGKLTKFKYKGMRVSHEFLQLRNFRIMTEPD